MINSVFIGLVQLSTCQIFNGYIGFGKLINKKVLHGKMEIE